MKKHLIPAFVLGLGALGLGSFLAQAQEDPGKGKDGLRYELQIQSGQHVVFDRKTGSSYHLQGSAVIEQNLPEATLRIRPQVTESVGMSLSIDLSTKAKAQASLLSAVHQGRLDAIRDCLGPELAATFRESPRWWLSEHQRLWSSRKPADFDKDTRYMWGQYDGKWKMNSKGS